MRQVQHKERETNCEKEGRGRCTLRREINIFYVSNLCCAHFISSDAIIGECVDQIGDTKLHPPTKRNNWGSHGTRKSGYGHHED